MADGVKVASLYYTIEQRGAKQTKKELDSAKDTIKRLGNESKKSSTKLGKFFEHLKRVGTYRAARMVLREISQGFREGVSAMYQWSRMSGTSFASSMDAMSTALQNMKNSFAAAFAPILENVIIPAVEKLSAVVMTAANALARFFAILGGQKTYTVAVTGATKQYTQAMNEAKKAILGFDELNVLNGASGGGGGYSAGDAFKEVDIGELTKFESKALEVFNKIKDVFSSIWGWLQPKLKKAFDWIVENLDTIIAVAALVGAAFLAWKLGKTLFQSLDNVLWFFGLILGAKGIYDIIQAFKDWGETGKVDIGKLILGIGEVLAGLLLMSTRLGAVKSSGTLAFDAVRFSIAALFGAKGISELIQAFQDFGKKGNESCMDVLGGISDIGIAVAALTKSPFILVISLVMKGFEKLHEWEVEHGYTSKLKLGETKNSYANNPVIIYDDVEALRKRGEAYDSSLLKTAGHYASGGFTSGDLFWANENGSNEFVGRIGNRSAVANNDQIVEAVSLGVYNAVSAALNGRNNNMSVKVYLDGREIKTSQQRLARATG